ncbi:hypothetical protein ACFQ5N_08500 [Lutibacter holmesii]|uniref:Outer membrane protein beta-barrel domain-containing protein n=1 Tax=Lutibacter holmesii TaxID=1137985 RepID=A0ABW3WQU6_9FLAO
MKNIIVLFFLIGIAFPFHFYGQESTTEKHPILTSKFQLGIGVFIPTQKVKFGVNASSENNEINFGETFDFNNNNARPNTFFDWRFAKKWKLSTEYFNASYSRQKELEEDIVAGDYTFGKGSEVKIGYKIDLFRLLVGTLISTGQQHELGAGLGAHVLNIGPYIEGNAIVNNNDNEFRTASVSATAPLPNLAIWYYYAPTKKWAFTARLDWFGLTYGDYSGSLWDISPSVRYQIIKNLAVSIDYRFFKLNANVNKDVWNGSFDLSFSGPTITLIGNLK